MSASRYAFGLTCSSPPKLTFHLFLKFPFGLWEPGKLQADVPAPLQKLHSRDGVYIPRCGGKCLDRPSCVASQSAQRWGLTWLLGRAMQNVLGKRAWYERQRSTRLAPSWELVIGIWKRHSSRRQPIAIALIAVGLDFVGERQREDVLINPQN